MAFYKKKWTRWMCPKVGDITVEGAAKAKDGDIAEYFALAMARLEYGKGAFIRDLRVMRPSKGKTEILKRDVSLWTGYEVFIGRKGRDGGEVGRKAILPLIRHDFTEEVRGLLNTDGEA